MAQRRPRPHLNLVMSSKNVTQAVLVLEGLEGSWRAAEPWHCESSGEVAVAVEAGSVRGDELRLGTRQQGWSP